MAATAVIYVGSAPGPQAAPPLPRHDLAVAADSGLAVARALGHRPDVRGRRPRLGHRRGPGVGRARGHDRGAPRPRQGPDRLRVGCRSGSGAGDRPADRGGRSGRPARPPGWRTSPCCASDDLADIEVEAWMGTARVTVIRHRRAIGGSPGLLVSLLVVGRCRDGCAHRAGFAGRCTTPRCRPVPRGGRATSSSAPRRPSRSPGVVTAIIPDVGAICPLIELPVTHRGLDPTRSHLT